MSYNGWTNYATWRVNLEMFDGLDPRDMGWHRMDKYELAPCLKDHAEEMLQISCPEGLALDYALSFIQDVDWREIAAMMLEEYASEETEEEEGEA